MWKTDVTYIQKWLDSLDDESVVQVAAAIELLAEVGPSLKRPVVGKIVGSKYPGMKELRPGSSGSSEMRILFMFDPERQAIMLLAGDKQRQWAKWYRKAIPEAERRYEEHLEKLKKQGD